MYRVKLIISFHICVFTIPLALAGKKCYVAHGEAKEKAPAVLQQFRDSVEVAILFMTPKTGGCGLNLTCATVVILYSPMGMLLSSQGTKIPHSSMEKWSGFHLMP